MKKKILSLALLAVACGGVDQSPQDEAWKRFEERATRVVDGQTLYMVEWDLAVSHEELRAYYDASIASSSSPNALGKAEQPLIVNVVSGRDDIWNSTQRFNLRYCVSNEFGNLKERVKSEMWSATAAWEGAANVRFIYDPSQDGSCTNANTNVTFSVRPWGGDGACAFFPSGSGCVARTLVIDYQDFPPNMTIGVLRHELGHVLGFRHEHIRPESGATSTNCNETGSWRVLTSYDRSSIMHYPSCNGVDSTLTSPWALTNLDRQGAASLYGAGTTPAGTNPIDRSDFFVRQVYRDVLRRDPDAGGAAFYTNVLQSCNGASACLASNRAAIARDLLQSQENIEQDPDLNRASPDYNSAFITHCYTNFLRRQPSDAEKSLWVNNLNAGGDYNAVVSAFITSAEYRQRFGAQ